MSATRVLGVVVMMSEKHHPNYGGDPEQFKRLQEAYETAMSSVA
jgi:hypothetical protein